MTTYAILDIETTGGKFNEEAITEIAIYKFDGHKVVDQFISLINPEKDIQPFVVNLTGINNDMLKNAPKFYEVAKRIVEITENCTLVAHNANFDYRILRTEFKRLGYTFERQTLCTVELSKVLIPDKKSYSLGKLVRSLGIPVTDRHRASGDALATVELFKLLLLKDVEKSIIQQYLKSSSKTQLPAKLVHIVDELPSKTGVYYIHNQEGTILFIGKSRNIKKRINDHFTASNAKAKYIQTHVKTVTFEITGSAFIASLKENEEIKRIRPKLNKNKHKKHHLALYSFKDKNGYLNLKISKIDGRRKAISTFVNIQSAKSFISKLLKQQQLCQQLITVNNTTTKCTNYAIKQCNGACVNQEAPQTYNLRIEQLIKKYGIHKQNLIITDQGRDVNEKSVILIKNGVLQGFGFFNLNYQINNLDILESLITPVENSKENLYIVNTYLRKNDRLKVIRL